MNKSRLTSLLKRKNRFHPLFEVDFFVCTKVEEGHHSFPQSLLRLALGMEYFTPEAL